MYKVKICSAIAILETKKTGQVQARTGSAYTEFFFCRVYHAAPFLKVRMEAALVRILTNLLFLICKEENLDENIMTSMA